MGLYMKDDNILRPKFKIVARNEPHEIIDHCFSELEEALSHYDLETDEDLLLSWLLLRSSILHWNASWED